MRTEKTKQSKELLETKTRKNDEEMQLDGDQEDGSEDDEDEDSDFVLVLRVLQ